MERLDQEVRLPPYAEHGRGGKRLGRQRTYGHSQFRTD